MYYVYQYIDPRSNLPFYVGKGTGERKFDHLLETDENTENKRKHKIIKEILLGGLSPLIEEVATFNDESSAYNFETELILRYGRKGFEKGGVLTNYCLGSHPPSRKGAKLTEEQKARIAANRKPLTEDQLNKRRGRAPWNKGKTGLQVAWNKGLTGAPGHPCSDENKELYRSLYTGKSRPELVKQNMKLGWEKKKANGYTPWNKGIKGGTSAKAIGCVFISPDGEEFIHQSYRQGCLAHNLPASMISNIRTGILTHCKGWTVRDLFAEVK